MLRESIRMSHYGQSDVFVPILRIVISVLPLQGTVIIVAFIVRANGH
jgi:hypothetical protein